MASDVTKAVLEALDQEDPNVLRAACVMAGVLELGQAERGLIKALGSKVWQVQAEAARALGRIKSKGAMPFLRRILKASGADVRQRMLAAAAGGGGAPAEDSEETHPEVMQAAAVALNRINPALAQDALLAALGTDQPDLLGAAMVGLANLQAQEGRERMMELLKHAEAGVRRTAAACLGKLAETRAVPALVELLQDNEAAVRKEALIALNNLKDKKALPAMAACLQDKDAEVRRVAAIALANTRSREDVVVQPLVEALKDREAAVRQAALKALGNLKAAAALEAAAELLTDTHEDVARQAGVTVVILGLARDKPDYE